MSPPSPYIESNRISTRLLEITQFSNGRIFIFEVIRKSRVIVSLSLPPPFQEEGRTAESSVGSGVLSDGTFRPPMESRKGL
ncbi:hypothetical protein ANTPLA_LOCUS941 [Anthophora plagiata]